MSAREGDAEVRELCPHGAVVVTLPPPKGFEKDFVSDGAGPRSVRLLRSVSPGGQVRPMSVNKPDDAIRSEKRKALFWKQIENAKADVAAWPKWVREAFNVR